MALLLTWAALTSGCSVYTCPYSKDIISLCKKRHSLPSVFPCNNAWARITHLRPFRSAGGATQRCTTKGSQPFGPKALRRLISAARRYTFTPVPFTPRLCFRKNTSDSVDTGGSFRKICASQVSGCMSWHPPAERSFARLALVSATEAVKKTKVQLREVCLVVKSPRELLAFR